MNSSFIRSHNKIMLFLAASLGLLIYIVLVSVTESSVPETGLEIPDWLLRSLDNPMCDPPCWNNITPGKSYVDEAYDIIHSQSEIKGIYQGGGSLSDHQRILTWYYQNASDSGEIYSDLDGKYVITIILYLREYITLEEVISRFDTPDQLTLFTCLSEEGPACEPRLLYLDEGLAFKFTTVPMKKSGNDKGFYIAVNPEDKIMEIMFSLPGINGYVQSTKNKHLDVLDRSWRWIGYGEYSYP